MQDHEPDWTGPNLFLVGVQRAQEEAVYQAIRSVVPTISIIV